MECHVEQSRPECGRWDLVRSEEEKTEKKVLNTTEMISTEITQDQHRSSSSAGMHDVRKTKAESCNTTRTLTGTSESYKGSTDFQECTGALSSALPGAERRVVANSTHQVLRQSYTHAMAEL